MISILMTAALMAAALPGRAEEGAPSAAAQRITQARLAMVREQLPLALALPVDIGETDAQAAARAQDKDCPQPYRVYRDALDDFARTVVTPMHSRKDPELAKQEFDRNYLCAAKIAQQAQPDTFQYSMVGKLQVVQAELSRLGPAERKQLVESLIAQRSLAQDRISRKRADRSVQSAVEIMSRLQDPKLNAGELEALNGAINPGESAKRFAESWLKDPLYAGEFRPPLPAHYRNLDEGGVPAATVAPGPIQSASLADFISRVSGLAGRASAYVKRVSAAIIEKSEDARVGIDARLTAALVWAESNFHSAARSWANCVGLGQLSKGVADAYRVQNREDINQNLKGTTGFLRDLIKQFARPEEQTQLRSLFTEEAAAVQKEIAAGKTKQQAIDDAFSQVWPRIPYGMKNAVAAYNAGPNAISRYGGWDKLPLPRGGCAHRRSGDSSYCQTEAYVPKVLKNYFTVYVETSQDPIDQRPDVFAAATPHYRSVSQPQSGL